MNGDKWANGNRKPDRHGLGAQTWNTFNKPTVFYCPLDVLSALMDEVERSGLSKTRIVVAAIRSYLDGLLDE